MGDRLAMGAVPQLVNPPGAPLPITGVTVTSSTVTVTGQVIDGDVAAFHHILVVAVFYDANGDPVGASQTVLDSIVPSQAESFSVSYPAVPNVDPALTKAFAYALRS